VNEQKSKALAAALAGIEKQFGKGAIMRMGEDNPQMQVEVISTGSLALDLALGIGGLPRGRVVEVYGPESSGKTTLTLGVIAQAQKRGLQCAFIDAEHALDINYAGNLGVQVSDLLISQPDNGEQGL
jgi:recombination protein RecA